MGAAHVTDDFVGGAFPPGFGEGVDIGGLCIFTGAGGVALEAVDILFQALLLTPPIQPGMFQGRLGGVLFGIALRTIVVVVAA